MLVAKQDLLKLGEFPISIMPFIKVKHTHTHTKLFNKKKKHLNGPSTNTSDSLIMSNLNATHGKLAIKSD